MLKYIHIGHMGIEKFKRRAREAVFWPCMNENIDNLISGCGTCQSPRFSNQKEPLYLSLILKYPWEIVDTDLFHWDNNDYLLVVDYFSRYIEISKLPNTQQNGSYSHQIQICETWYSCQSEER
ncbi:hypothetical protein HOLleu_26647 [Holothuria leucospilota]|uniref:Integrase zinc-binding domain-containing protein n=1 Tax=Holothuria leucospilota TaxID=206669 RepID=A0A9Q1H074_HOLLE|nr:hypothetical protein HOLleu_26647 [Holothuria leucospilota]